MIKNKALLLFSFVLLLCLPACGRSYKGGPQQFIPPICTPYKPVQEENPFSLISQVPKRGLIMIDPGHGGEDFGTHSRKPHRYQEKFLTLTTGKMVKTHLERMGYTVILTRTSDVFISLDGRYNFANEQKPNLFVSVHYNSAPNKDAFGVEVFYYNSAANKTRSTSSKVLAQNILSRIIENTDAKSRGVKHGDLAVIRETTMPAVLVEGGFLTNESERKLIKTAEYQKKISWGIAQGIHDYLNSI